jgi:hypothetical protein
VGVERADEGEGCVEEVVAGEEGVVAETGEGRHIVVLIFRFSMSKDYIFFLFIYLRSTSLSKMRGDIAISRGSG